MGQTLDSLSLFFYLSDAQLTMDSKSKLDALLLKSDHLQVSSINAFCDPSGTSGFNKTLAKNRSESVQNYLTEKGVSCNSIKITGENYSQTKIRKEDYQNLRKVVLTYTVSIPEVVEVINENPFGRLSMEDIKSKKNNSIVLKLQFVPGQDVLLDDSSFINVYQFFEFMKYNENVHAFIRGHVCCANDYELSYARANMVYAELVRRGISPKRLSTKGFSNTEPLVSPEITDADRQKNRRVDVIFSIPTEE